MSDDPVWRYGKWIGAAIALAVMVMVNTRSPVREADVALTADHPLPALTLDGARVDQAWFGGQPGVILLWLPG